MLLECHERLMTKLDTPPARRNETVAAEASLDALVFLEGLGSRVGVYCFRNGVKAVVDPPP